MSIAVLSDRAKLIILESEWFQEQIGNIVRTTSQAMLESVPKSEVWKEMAEGFVAKTYVDLPKHIIELAGIDLEETGFNEFDSVDDQAAKLIAFIVNRLEQTKA